MLSFVWSMPHWRRELLQLIKLDLAELAAWFTVSALMVVALAAGVAVGVLVGMFLQVRKRGTARLSTTFQIEPPKEQTADSASTSCCPDSGS